MSVESAKEFMKRVREDKTFLESIEKKIDSGVQAVLEEAGFDFSRDELVSVMGELSDDELRAIPGASGSPSGVGNSWGTIGNSWGNSWGTRE